MGLASKRESHVLKLVHPGGFVELHTKPVMASHVMSKNPRHYVTRPDIFKFPWIVVSPESILTPGNVFFIVPSHTIRCLIKNPTTSSLKQQQQYYSHVTPRKLSKSNNKLHCFRDQSSTTMSCITMSLRTTSRQPPQKQNNNKAQSFVRERPHPTHYSGGSLCRCDKKVPDKLKPCLKKDSMMSHSERSRNLRVRFEDQQLKSTTFEFATEEATDS